MTATRHPINAVPGPTTAAGTAAAQILDALEKMASDLITEQLKAMY